MSVRLNAAFAALAERGTVAGANTVWQRAVLAAAVDDRPELTSGDDMPLVPVDPPQQRRPGGRRVGVLVGVGAVALIAAGASALFVRGGRDDEPQNPGDVEVPPTTGVDTSAPFAATTAGGELPSLSFAPTTPGGEGVPITTIAIAPLADQPVRACHAAAFGTEAPLVTTAGPDLGAGATTTFPPPEPCPDPAGTLPRANPGNDSVESPITVAADQPVAYWRIVDDLEIGWRMDDGMSVLYWRTPAGTGRVLDDFFGSKVVLIPTADAYLVLARPDVHAGDTRGPTWASLSFTDGSELGAALFEYDNEITIGVARFTTTAPVARVTVS